MSIGALSLFDESTPGSVQENKVIIPFPSVNLPLSRELTKSYPPSDEYVIFSLNLMPQPAFPMGGVVYVPQSESGNLSPNSFIESQAHFFVERTLFFCWLPEHAPSKNEKVRLKNKMCLIDIFPTKLLRSKNINEIGRAH